jgi:small subunit ribosomal protein S3
MGQKVHPYGFRLGYTKPWRSRWFAKQGYAALLHEDLKLKASLRKRLKAAGISSVEVDRPGNRLRITIRTARPGIIIGRRGSEIEKLKQELQQSTQREIYIDIQEVHRPELDAQLVSESVALQIVKRVAFRRAMRKAVDSALRFGSKGIKVWVAGRLNGREIARSEWYLQGRLPLQTLRADIDYGFSEAHTTYGVIGVKCWIYKGDLLDQKALLKAASGQEELEPARRREARSVAEREREKVRAARTVDRTRGDVAVGSAPAAPAPGPGTSGPTPVQPPVFVESAQAAASKEPSPASSIEEPTRAAVEEAAGQAPAGEELPKPAAGEETAQPAAGEEPALAAAEEQQSPEEAPSAEPSQAAAEEQPAGASAEEEPAPSGGEPSSDEPESATQPAAEEEPPGDKG